MQPSQVVYSYYFPEVADAIEDIYPFPHEPFWQNIEPGLDEFEKPFIERYTDFFGDLAWDQFPHRYVTAGSSEALFKLMAEWATVDYGMVDIYQLEGEYQGYQAYADSLFVPLTTVKDYMLPEMPPGLVFLSNPSARDGNLLSHDLFTKIVERHKVVLDVAYLGLTRHLNFNIDHPNILAVVTSMSKPFGLYYHRIGICFSRMEIKSLYGNRWFKNLNSIMVGEAVLKAMQAIYLDDRNAFDCLQQRLLEYQARAMSDAGLAGFASRSDVPLLCHSKTNNSQMDDAFKRGDRWRYCLTPYFMEYDRQCGFIPADLPKDQVCVT